MAWVYDHTAALYEREDGATIRADGKAWRWRVPGRGLSGLAESSVQAMFDCPADRGER